MDAIILAGGLGTRLSSRLTDRPKPMAPIAGRPFLALLLDRLIQSGCTRLILSVCHMRQTIIDEFGSRYRQIPIEYVIEEVPLGTGGAIRMALEQAVEPQALVLNGDTFLDVDYSALLGAHVARGRPMTMAVTGTKDMGRYGGVVVQDDHVVGFIEKGCKGPGWINAGVYVLNRNFPWPSNLAPRFSFETDVLVPSLDSLYPAAFRCSGYFLDIGIPEDLDRAQTELAPLARQIPG